MFSIFFKRLEFSSRTRLCLVQRVNGFCIHLKQHLPNPAVQESGMRSHLSIWLCLLLLTFNPWSVMASKTHLVNFDLPTKRHFSMIPIRIWPTIHYYSRILSWSQPWKILWRPKPVQEGDPFEEPVQQDEQYLDEGTFLMTPKALYALTCWHSVKLLKVSVAISLAMSPMVLEQA